MKIGVVGSGISGIGAAWLLSKQHEVHLFEAESRLGGHAHTVVVNEAQNSIPMDTGFLVYNELTYPHLTQFFKHLNVETMESSMSLSVQVQQKNLEWSGGNLNTIFGQRKNIFKLSFYKMLLEILRFGREAETNRQAALRHAWTLGELLQARKYSEAFKTDYLLPIGAAIWSTPETKMLEFPASTFLTFFINHKLLQVNNRPVWRTVKNGSVEYVKKAAAAIQHVHLSSAVVEVRRSQNKVFLKTSKEAFEFDAVVLATHAPITAKILKDQSPEEQSVLTAISYELNKAFLHNQEELMPRAKRCWSAWNVYGEMNTNIKNETSKVSLTYHLNELQKLPTSSNYFLTLNPTKKIDNFQREIEYAHPQFNQTAIRAQRQLPSIQGQGGVYFAGAWTRYGFHEDGLLSAVQVAELLGVCIPWTVKNE